MNGPTTILGDRYDLRRITAWLLVLALVGTASASPRITRYRHTVSGSEPARIQAAAAAPLSMEEATAIATEAYIFGYPLVTMDTTRRVMTNVPAPDGTRAPMGQFLHARIYPDPTFHDVTAPNVDTLYSVAWLDLGKEPYILHVPDENGRYYLMPILDAWTNVQANPGTRTTGAKAADFAITGPDWQGNLPAGVTRIKSPTNMAWVLGRTYSTGSPADLQAVHAIQDKYSLTPLSSWGKNYVPPSRVAVDPAIDMKTPPRVQVNAMDAAAYFAKLASLMRDNPPAPADAAIVAKMAKIGIVPGGKFDLTQLDPEVANGIRAGAKAGLEKIVVRTGHLGQEVNGWEIPMTGIYGTDYLLRAAVAFAILGANRPQDSCYAVAKVDGDDKPLDGTQRYVWHFAKKGDLPPVDGFWSLTMYNADYFLVVNPLNRYTIGQRDQLKENADGSIDVYLQKDSPGTEKESNWLPAPEGNFVVFLRMYWPKESFLQGPWEPPPLTKTR